MIKIGYLVSYDYEMLFTSLKLVYEHSDKIFLSIDKERKTWTGNNFEIPDTFFKRIKEIDTDNKIEFHEESFYIAELKNPADCETRQRNLLLKRMGKGWKIQLDVDEYIYDFKKVVDFLNKFSFLAKLPYLFPIVLRGKLVTLFKKLPEGFLYIDNGERFSFITNQYRFKRTRNNLKFKNHFTNIVVIHQSWAREENEIEIKVNNWGHKNDFDTHKYFKFWQKIDEHNYKYYENFHPLNPIIWKKILFLKSESISDFIDKYSFINRQEIIPINIKVIVKCFFRIVR